MKAKGFLIFGILTMIMVSGCSMENAIVRRASSYNRAIEDAQNQMLLLNIIRASKDRPMYFTRIGSISNSVKFSTGTGTLSIPFGGDATDIYSIGPTASASGGPTFEVSALDTQEFMKGIMTPIKVETFKYYVEQGWPDELLACMFIEYISYETMSENNKSNRKLDNYPRSKEKFFVFSEVLKNREIEFSNNQDANTNNQLNLILNSEALQSIEHIMKAHEGNYTLKNTDKRDIYEFQLESPRKTTKELVIKFKDKILDGEMRDATIDRKILKRAKGFFNKDDAEKLSKEANTAAIALDKGSFKAERQMIPSEGNNTIVLRSPEAMIYYLGEIVRRELDRKYNEDDSWIKIDNKTLFAVEECKAISSKGYAVKVSYEGKTYGIPNNGDDDDRSMKVLSLLSQLIALHKSAKDLPETGTVRLISN